MSNNIVTEKARENREAANPVVLMVQDCQQTQLEMKRVLELNGYRVVDTDNGRDAARHASNDAPDLLLVDLDVPLLYGMVAARQIIKNARLGTLPVIVVSREAAIDRTAIMEVGVRPNEYVTRLPDQRQLEHLLGYLFPVKPQLARA